MFMDYYSLFHQILGVAFSFPAHEVGAGDIVIALSGVRPCFVSERYVWNR